MYENEEYFILAEYNNSHVAEMQKEVSDQLQVAIDSDEAFRQLYQTMDQEIQAGKAKAPEVETSQQADPNAAPQ